MVGFFIDHNKALVTTSFFVEFEDNDLDKFLVAGNMSRFDNLFSALGIYQNYKEYTNSVILNDDLLLEEIYEKFVLN